MPRELFCFSHHSGVFSLCMTDFYTATGCFLFLHRFPGTLSLCQAGIYLSRLISRAFFFSPDTFSPAMARQYTSGRHTARIRTGHDSGTVSSFVHSTLSPLPPVFHPQSTVHLRQLLSTHTVGKEPEVLHHLKKLLRDVLFQPRDQLTLCQRFRRRLSRFWSR